MQPREEEATYYYHRGDKSSQRNQRRLRQTQEEQPISKPKVFSKSYTANPVAKGKPEDSISKAESRTRTTGRVLRPSQQVELETKQKVEKSSASEEEAHETKEAEVVIEPKEAEVILNSLTSSEDYVEILVKEIYQDQLLLEIEEKKPDSPQFFPIKDGTVSRTKLFQEEGYDVIMESSEKTRVPCSAQTKYMINLSIPSATWSTFSPHLEHTSKLNQSNQSSSEEVIQLPSQVIPSLRDSDICAFNNHFQPNQKESSYETNYSGILNHHRIWENWINNNAGPDLGDMNFTSQWICFRPYCATEPKIVMHSPTQVRYQRQTNWRILLDLLGFQQAQEQKKWISDHKVIAHLPKWVNLVLYLKNSKPSPIKSLHNYVWHPGTSTKPKGQCMAQNKVSNSWS